MRLDRVLLSLLVLGGVSFAQDMHFPIGPQYLATTGNPMLLRTIATPSISLSGGSLAGTSEVPTPAEPSAFAPLETVAYLDNVYWGDHKPAEIVARRVETPILSPDQTAWYMNFVASQLTSPPPSPAPETSETTARASVIELSGSPIPNNLPASILDVGVTGEANPLVPRERGVSLGDVAAYWKSHRRTAARVLNNSDVTRLRG